ncbi:hypothetical protein PINS_up008167 [Pythium insidiosum]|nr:hypothetical protein PINS_up008167 [Pythium insidiosum]
MEQDWEMVAANEVHVVDELKKQGNALFQRRQFIDAVQSYSRALERLPVYRSAGERFTAHDVDALTRLEVAVRLNRALAYIELQDDKLLIYAEQDCSRALELQPDGVKALYRRALARERMGNVQVRARERTNRSVAYHSLQSNVS